MIEKKSQENIYIFKITGEEHKIISEAYVKAYFKDIDEKEIDAIAKELILKTILFAKNEIVSEVLVIDIDDDENEEEYSLVEVRTLVT